MEAEWTPPERDWWQGIQRKMLRRDKIHYWIRNEVGCRETIMFGTAILQESHRNGQYDGVLDRREIELMQRAENERML